MAICRSQYTRVISYLSILIIVISLLYVTPDYLVAHAYLSPQPPGEIVKTRLIGGHLGSVAWSPDGTMIAVGGYSINLGGRVVLFSVNGSIVWIKTVSAASILSLAWSPDGSKIVAGGGDWRVTVLARNGSVLWSENLGEVVYSVAWSPDGSKIVAGTIHGRVVEFDSEGNILWSTQVEEGAAYSVAWSPNSSRIAVGSGWSDDQGYHGFLTILDDGGDVIWEEVLNGTILSVSWSPDGSKIAVGMSWNDGEQDHGYVQVFSSNGSLLWSSNDFGATVYSVSYHTRNESIAVGLGWGGYNSYSGAVILLDPNGNALWTKFFYSPVASISWSPSGTEIAVGLRYSNVSVFSYQGGLILETQDLGGQVIALAWSPDGSWIAMNGEASGRIVLLDPQTMVMRRIAGIGGDALALAWSPDGSKIVVAAGFANTVISVVDTYGNMYWSHTIVGRATSVSWSGDGSKISLTTYWSGYQGEQSVVEVYAPNGTLLWNTTFQKRVLSSSWSPDGERLAVGYGSGAHGRLVVLGSDRYQVWKSGDIGPVRSVSWSPDGKRLAAVVDVEDEYGRFHGWVYVYARNGTLLWKRHVGDYFIYEVEWSPDGGLLALTGDTNVILYYMNGSKLCGTSPLGGSVTSIAWSPDGKSLVVGVSFGGIAIVNWTQCPVGTIRIHGIPSSLIDISGVGGAGSYIIPSNGTLLLYASPGEYMINYSLPRPAGFVGNSSALNGLLNITLQSDEDEEISLPGYYSLLGRIKLTSPVGGSVIIQWSGGVANISLHLGEERTLYAAPGGYIIHYTIAKPPLYVGSIEDLSGNISLTVSSGRLYSLELPSYDDILGLLSISGPAGSTITVRGRTHYANFTMPSTGNITIWLAPGNYSVIIYYSNSKITRNITVSKGESVTLNYSPTEFVTPSKNATSTTTYTTSTSSNIPSETGEISSQQNTRSVQNTTGGRAPQRPSGTLTWILIVVSTVLVSIILIIKYRKI
ncbi:MAG: hypothetical protein F7C35_05310 [Desulfurococcales archaeon]|nr:hypothetical protein [Desulfurococcales archaeon]